MFQISDSWKNIYPQAHVGMLVMRNVINPPHHTKLDRQKAALEEQIRLLLTAGHDLDALRLPATLNVAVGEEKYTTMRGIEQTLKAGDMFIADSDGIISSIIYGPDEHTQINPQTRNVIFTVYAPAGIEIATIEEHLQKIQQNVLTVAPRAETEMLKVIGTD